MTTATLVATMLCILLCTLVTWLPRLLPLYVFSRDLPSWLKDWLNFIPAAVMAALVAPDVFLYGGSFNPNPLDNLFLLAALAATVFGLIVRNFFATIVFAMAFVAVIRSLGLAS